jgi:hypothetical protein
MTKEEMLAELIDERIVEHIATIRDDLHRHVDEHVERLRSALYEKLLELRSPNFQLTPKGELYCDGKRVGDVRPVFREVVDECLSSQREPPS